MKTRNALSIAALSLVMVAPFATMQAAAQTPNISAPGVQKRVVDKHMDAISKAVAHVKGAKVKADYDAKIKDVADKVAAYKKVFEDFKALAVKDQAAIDEWSQKQQVAFLAAREAYVAIDHWAQALIQPVSHAYREAVGSTQDRGKNIAYYNKAMEADSVIGDLRTKLREEKAAKAIFEVYTKSTPNFRKLVQAGKPQTEDTSKLAITDYFAEQMKSAANPTPNP